jgi:hypothetical protein
MRVTWTPFIVCCLVGPLAYAQQACHTDAATQPGKGQLYVRHMLQYVTYGKDPKIFRRDVTEWMLMNELTFGLTGNLSVRAELPIMQRTMEIRGEPTMRDVGLHDLTLSVRWRAWQNDFGPVDTTRLMLIAGVQLPIGSHKFHSSPLQGHTLDGITPLHIAAEFTKDSVPRPLLGFTLTHIHDRHGFNVSARYLFNFVTDSSELDFRYVHASDSDDDLLTVDLSYLYRLSPARYQPDTAAAWYLVLELNNIIGMDGDREMLLSPGILFEAKNYALELSVQIPVHTDVRNRPPLDYSITAGFRILF